MKWLSGWWRRPDHFDWLTGYLQARGLSVNTRRALAAVAASLVLVPANVVWGPTPFYPRLALAVAALAGLAGLGMAALWLSRWPLCAPLHTGRYLPEDHFGSAGI
ncbi:MAG: hypothetical protein ACLP4W_10570 [Mycobacterium sp.]|uniref:hypothetical protein n=1 Tax=Mycobacterium sp. TaxID=1785 RepID=UPI003F952353